MLQFSGTPTTKYSVEDQDHSCTIQSNFKFTATVGSETKTHHVAIQDALHPGSKACVRAPYYNAIDIVVIGGGSTASSSPSGDSTSSSSSSGGNTASSSSSGGNTASSSPSGGSTSSSSPPNAPPASISNPPIQGNGGFVAGGTGA